MRAAVYHGQNDITVVDVEEPECPPGHVKIQVAFNGICGSDLHEYYAGPLFIPTEPHPLTGAQLPITLGHEFAGRVVDVGDGVPDISAGDRVAVEAIYRCEECSACRAGHYNACRKLGFHGLMSDGGMAECTVVPAHMAHKLPDSVNDELGALVEPMSVAYHAAQLGEVSTDATAVIFGAGPIGIGLWFALRGLGVEDITVVEPAPARREAMGRLGATDIIDPTKTDPAHYVQQRTGHRGADAVYDAAGVQSAVESALSCLGTRNRMISVAIYEKPFPVTLLNLVMTEATVRGSLAYTGEDYRAVIDLMASGHYDTTGWVSHVPIDHVVEEGFAALRAGRKMKVLVDPSG